MKELIKISRVRRVHLWLALCLLLPVFAASSTSGKNPSRFEISYPGSLDKGPITGRVFVMISKSNRAEPRLQAGQYFNVSTPFYGVDVNALAPETDAIIDASVPGYPVESLSQLPAGEY